ncbi:hypothetical protein K9O30_06220 [Clostridium bowmanii]|uniref:hypothetical protein n=1 Tax=Clostridium bowmanii TaxID=132925 RepID=UPI001C0BFD22|nr:hypothetical protein [Clostridium bowmanii]MBU3188755.1 hypothetical protein [Clostridium bowmanii]MCA1073340.1 hypothetical protein [Clostridium bowmanii]
MDKKEAKEFSNDAIYGLSEMLALIDSQTNEIDYLKDKLANNININVNMADKITNLENQIEDINEYPSCHTEKIEFDGEYDFYDK